MHNYILLVLVTQITSVDGYVKAYPPRSSNLTIQQFSDKEAEFGPEIPEEGLQGQLFLARPLNACQSVFPAVVSSHHAFLLIKESSSQQSCSYAKQVFNAQKAGYEAAIIYRNSPSSDIATMSGEGSGISAVCVHYESGIALQDYLFYTNSIIRISGIPTIPLQLYLVPFAVVVGICFFFMFVFSLGRYCRYRVRQKRARLSPANLKKIPTKKFKKGDEYDMCAICIEEYEENDKIRILPCNHAYHCKCVDPWLTSGKKLCPVCKQPADPEKKKKRKNKHLEPFDNASTGSQQTATEESAEESTDERTPLLSSTQEVRHSGAIDV